MHDDQNAAKKVRSGAGGGTGADQKKIVIAPRLKTSEANGKKL